MTLCDTALAPASPFALVEDLVMRGVPGLVRPALVILICLAGADAFQGPWFGRTRRGATTARPPLGLAATGFGAPAPEPPPSSASNQKKQGWTEDEDALLVTAQDRWGDKAWSRIATVRLFPVYLCFVFVGLIFPNLMKSNLSSARAVPPNGMRIVGDVSVAFLGFAPTEWAMVSDLSSSWRVRKDKNKNE